MNEQDKKKIKEFAAKTGKKVFSGVRLKGQKPKIVPYDGDDAYYIDIPDAAQEKDFIEKINVTVNGENPGGEQNDDTAEPSTADRLKQIVRDVKDLLGNKISKGGNTESEEDTQAQEPHGRETAEYFKSISKKLDGIKSGITDVMKRGEQGIDGADNKKLGRYMSEVTERLDDINRIIEHGISELSASTGDIRNGVADTKDRYNEISEGIRSVTKTTEENVEKISALSDNIDGVRNRVDEIHSTTNSIDKLYDSVFELKSSNTEFKKAIEEMRAAQDKRFKILMASIAAVGVIIIIVCAVLLA